MSPFRRFCLAWIHRWWELPLLLLFQIGLCALQLESDSIPDDGWANALRLERFALMSLFIPMFLGLRLRMMLSAESLSLCQPHRDWHLRIFFFAIMPLATSGIIIPLMLTGASLLFAAANGILLTTLAAWVGITTRLIALPVTVATMYGLPALVAMAKTDSSLTILLCAELLLGVSCIALAWQRMHRLRWRDHTHRPHPLVARFLAWVEHATHNHTAIAHHHRAFPGLGSIVRAHVMNIARAGRMHLIVGAGMTAMSASFILFSDARESMVAESFPLAILVAMMVGMCTFQWAMRYTNQAQSNMRGLLAVERLRPFSRSRGAVLTMTSLALNGLANAGSSIAGLSLGLLAADLVLGHSLMTHAFWWIIPLALATAIAAAALALTCLTTPILVVLLGLCTTTVLFALAVSHIAPSVLSITPGSGNIHLILLIFISILAALLTPIAWRRLATAELP